LKTILMQNHWQKQENYEVFRNIDIKRSTCKRLWNWELKIEIETCETNNEIQKNNKRKNDDKLKKKQTKQNKKRKQTKQKQKKKNKKPLFQPSPPASTNTNPTHMHFFMVKKTDIN